MINLYYSCQLGDRSLEFIQEPTIGMNPNEAVPLAAVIKFQTNKLCESLITISDGKNEWVLAYDTTRNPQNGLPVLGMRPDKQHDIFVEIRYPKSSESKRSQKLVFKTPSLPKDPLDFPKIEVKKIQKEKMEPGITLFNPRLRIAPGYMSPQEIRQRNQGFGMLTAVDASGEVVWYYRGTSRISDFERLSNGNILYLTQDYTAVEIDILGNEVSKWYATGRPEGPIDGAIPVETLTFHHDIEELPNGNFLVLGTDRRLIKDYYTSEWDKNAPRKDQWAMGDEIVEFQRDGKVVWTWNAYDYLDPYRFSYQALSGYWIRRGWPETMDWSHCNGLDYVKADDSIILNSRYFSAVFNIDHKTGEINWIAGEPSDWSEELQKKLLTLENVDRWFWHQHAPRFTPQGTLLLFDNGNFQARPFDKPLAVANTHSRAANFEIDPKNKTIREIWSTDIPGEPKVVSFAMGSVQWLPEKQNILTGWGLLLPTERLENIEWQSATRSTTWSRIREYTYTNPPEVVWEVNLISQDPSAQIGWTTFGAKRLANFLPRIH
jgi:hypothetical protein